MIPQPPVDERLRNGLLTYRLDRLLHLLSATPTKRVGEGKGRRRRHARRRHQHRHADNGGQAEDRAADRRAAAIIGCHTHARRAGVRPPQRRQGGRHKRHGWGGGGGGGGDGSAVAAATGRGAQASHADHLGEERRARGGVAHRGGGCRRGRAAERGPLWGGRRRPPPPPPARAPDDEAVARVAPQRSQRTDAAASSSLRPPPSRCRVPQEIDADLLAAALSVSEKLHHEWLACRYDSPSEPINWRTAGR